MGKDMKYLLDTNILIYYIANKIPQKELSTIEKILEEDFNISIITKIEFLGWKYYDYETFLNAKEFINLANIIPLNNEIAEIAIKLRRKYNLKLGDAVIAATSLFHDLTLVTRNEKDFKKVKEIKIYNPFK